MAAHLWQAASYKSFSSKLKTTRIILSTGVLDRDDIFMYIHTGRLMPAIAKTVGSTGDHQDRIFQAIGSGGLGDDVIKQLWPSDIPMLLGYIAAAG